jgi:hypothetical protein
MSNLLNDILKYSKLHFDYLVEASRKSVFERYTWDEMVINFVIPILVIIVFVFILKKRYMDKKVKIKLASNFKKKIRKQEKFYSLVS